MNNRLCLKNVPISMTKNQILSTFFPDLENVEIHFPKRLRNANNNTRFVFAELKSRNEAVLSLKLINRLEYQKVEASYAEPKIIKSVDDTVTPQVYCSKKCAFCGESDAKFVCNDCSTLYFTTFYCCKDHQERDWTRHKIECRPLPKLRRADDLFKTDSNENWEENSLECDPLQKAKYFIHVKELGMEIGTKVVITSVINNRIIYIRPLSSEIDDLSNKIRKYSLNAPLLSKKPMLDEYVLAPFNGSYHRAKILDLFETDHNGFNSHVVLADYGNELKLKWQDMKQLNYRIRGRPTFTNKVILNGITDENFNHNANDYLNEMCATQEILEIEEIFGNQVNNRRVILKNVQTGEIINDVIRGIVDRVRIEKIFYDITKVPQFSTTSTIKIFASDCSQLEEKKLLSCIPYEKFIDYFHMIDELNKYCKRMLNEPYTPQFNEICLVKHNERWYRAGCFNNNLQNDYIEFVLIDLIINVKIHKDDIRKIPLSFSQHFYTSLCFVEGINDENGREFRKKVEADKFIYADVRYDNETPHCPILCNISFKNV